MLLKLLPKVIKAFGFRRERQVNRVKWYVIGFVVLLMCCYALITGDFGIFWRILSLLIGGV